MDVTLGIGIGSLAAAIIALFALGISIYSAVISTKSLGASTRSAHAAELSAGAVQRSADADEEMVRLAKSNADRPEVPWHLIKEGRSYRLMNNSDEEARNVEISGSVMASDFENGDAIPARSAIRLLDMRTLASSDPLSVTWSRPGRDERLGPWTQPL
ncbi:hypothetical protein [Streptomonospora wellingtoniae]|uniref:Uncharacterized protein n=1 Tax=Streptomonospora wellingtoniae TaxID=3075544 RepID=A0ABU2KWX8_9ACTN|nr:hypothetical protein [Streptomonospora sp. DSM 45055]MDT0303548.1 hypothetical protein [Streptomonospora sp. DSM 45055]